ncbi:hypothetical protein D3C76_1037520 [compost metagenome]
MFDTGTERLVFLFQLTESALEGRQIGASGQRIAQGRLDDLFGLPDVCIERGLQGAKLAFDISVERQAGVGIKHALEAFGVFAQIAAHLGGTGGVGITRQKSRQHVRTQCVVHHVAFQVVAQGAGIEFSLGQGRAQPYLAQVANRTEASGGQYADNGKTHHLLTKAHAVTFFLFY